MKKPIGSLQKGLEILTSFDFGNECLSAREISKRLNFPLSTTYKYLETLKENRFLVRNQETKNYELGFMLFKLGNIISSRMKLGEIILPHMESLSSLSGETVLLTVISGWEVMCIERVETQRAIKLSLARGARLPLHAGASSKVLLAYQEDSLVDSMLRGAPLIRFTKTTITDPVQLKKELTTIRSQGFAFSDQEVDLGAIAIGAPIFDHKGRVAAGLSAAGPRERIRGKKRIQLIRMVKEFAEKASYDLGHRVAK